MTTLLYVGIVLEMIFVNLMTIHICSKKKYSNLKIFSAMIGYTAVIVTVFMSIIGKFPAYGNGNGAFVLAGFTYLIPLKFLYDEKLTRILEIVCSSWIYTLFAFIISVHLANLFRPDLFSVIVFATQTIFYLMTVTMFWRFIREKFIFILRKIPESTLKYLRYGSLLWFLAILVLNFSFIFYDNGYFKVISLIFLGSIACITYLLIYEVTASSNSALRMEEIATTDYLTKLPNRYSLYKYVQALIEENIKFAIIYMDLNNFKSVNDKLGHVIGDKYLKLFADTLSEDIKSEDRLYRISGDEFLCVTKDIFTNTLEDIVKNIDFKDKEAGSFLGVSYGTAKYPKDGNTFDKILAAADSKMYENKRSRKNK